MYIHKQIITTKEHDQKYVYICHSQYCSSVEDLPKYINMKQEEVRDVARNT